MAKLYPPILEGAIPSFYSNVLSIPFTMNKAVSMLEINGFNLIIKTVNTSKLLGQFKAELNEWDKAKNIVNFTIDEELLNIGQYYKAQLAYIDLEGNIGYYSSIATVKYTTKPEIRIDGLDIGQTNIHRGSYVGYYSSEDLSERVYSYKFDIYNSKEELFESSGTLLHNSQKDEDLSYSQDVYSLKKELNNNQTYYVQYSIITNNNLEIKSSKYRVMAKETINPELEATVEATLNAEEGYIKIKLNSESEKAAYGSYVLKRASSKDDFNNWDTICYFKLRGQLPRDWSWTDFTIEHGFKYKYALQQFNDSGLYSNRIESKEVEAKFEHSYLFDGEKQLKIKFNPKVSSFKNVILESKTDTIGSQYPYVFRNDVVYYKEFPISGLISYLSDAEELFISGEEIKLQAAATSLEDANILSERIFKQKVHEFLNDGKPKIFRSPGEGNYIVRIMNVSLSPIDTVGRMLHSFSANAYEIASFNYDNLLKLGFLKVLDLDIPSTQWEQIDLATKSTETNLINHAPATSLRIENARFGSEFLINETTKITIGPSGFYSIELGDGINITSVKMESTTPGILTYTYNGKEDNNFETLQDINIFDSPMISFYGEYNIHKKLNNIKHQVANYIYLRFTKRPVYDYSESNKVDWALYKKDENTYWDTRIGSMNYYSTKIQINDSIIDIGQMGEYELTNLDNITTLKIDNGVNVEILYQVKEFVYLIESTDELIQANKKLFEALWQQYMSMLQGEYTDGSFCNQDGTYNDKYFSALEQVRAQLFPKNYSSPYDKYVQSIAQALEE